MKASENVKRVFVAGHNGMVGSAICRRLSEAQPSVEIVTRDRSELDLTCQDAVREFFLSQTVDEVYLSAAKVGGIHANSTFPVEFLVENLLIQTNVIEAAFKSGVKKLLFLGSSCIYPRNADNPIAEAALLSGKLEPTNEPYAIAKIAGIKLCESFNRQFSVSHGIDYRAVMPTNLYGVGDSYHPENSHVIPALIRRIHEAKITRKPHVTIWGTGQPKREFLFSDDLADACLHVMSLKKSVIEEKVSPMCSHINVGSGEEVSILELAKSICNVVGYSGDIVCDPSRPDGNPRKLLDTGVLQSLGWRPSVRLRSGLSIAYSDFRSREWP